MRFETNRLAAAHPAPRRVRRLGQAALALLILAASTGAQAASPLGFDAVAAKAQALAKSSYHSPNVSLPGALADLKFEQYAQIQYKEDRALWHGERLPYELTFFHEGMQQYNIPVKIHIVGTGGVHDVKFDPSGFDYGSNKFDPDDLKNLQFAGLRVQAPINARDRYDQILVFQGASYLRAIGKGQRFGLSTRGLAVDTALPSGEEFPQFVEFWVERPAHNAQQLVVYALMDSPRVTGAYRFTVHPGVTTVTDVKARVFLRENVGKLGLAPLTGMFLFGPNQPSPIINFRPALHDSEGLSIHTGEDRWIWRPLVDPKALTVSSFALTDPKGFGLMQRSHDFADYQDLFDRYDLRPSGWVEPKGRWGKGKVELVEIPTPDETNDNIVAYWVPAQPPKPLQPLDYEYSVHWENTEQTLPQNVAHVSQTRFSMGTVKQADLIRKPDGSQEFVIDFAGKALDGVPEGAPPVEAVVEADPHLQIVHTEVTRNDAVGGYRLALRFRPKANDSDSDKGPKELRAYLHSGSTTLSETWSYLLPATPAL
ncbi:glucan biosynthesis protein G [Frateuria defendens]|uniref:glucan biosynthesis protein G n=1 Tax=Frateuria defendens TaxID=2219559 RepID=UPI0009E57D0E|nr:glucan biosynthesis protein G [Frateuria defendens]